MGGLGESRRRFCCVCLLWVVGGMAKIEGATDKVIKGRDQETNKEAWWERGGGLLPSDGMSI